MKVALVYTPEKIHPDVVEWLTDGWSGNRDDVIPFLKHLMSLRHGSSQDADGVIIIERGIVLDPNFDEKIGPILSIIPSTYTTCLLSHYVTSWSNIRYVDGTDNLLAVPTEAVLSSFAYWIRMTHVERLLSMYDQPLRYIPSFKFNPEKISRLGSVCMTCTPLAARLDENRFREYYSVYGFV